MARIIDACLSFLATKSPCEEDAYVGHQTECVLSVSLMEPPPARQFPRWGISTLFVSIVFFDSSFLCVIALKAFMFDFVSVKVKME